MDTAGAGNLLNEGAAVVTSTSATVWNWVLKISGWALEIGCQALDILGSGADKLII